MRRVLLGFSGGIDSCTSVLRLRDAGYTPVALTIDTIGDDKMLVRARDKAIAMGVEWRCYDAREAFEREIIDYFCREYASGRTPAPCTRCNTHIKWRILASVADEMGIEHIATGHYFNIVERSGRYYVAKGVDPNKDQSYYLWGLSQEILRRALTPMGDAIKSDVKRAFEDKSESMGVCFLQGRPYADFLAQRGVVMLEGDVVDRLGSLCGRHTGIARYTIGQRRGEGIPVGMCVQRIDANSNRIVVGNRSDLFYNRLCVEECNVVDNRELMEANDITIKIRGIGHNPTLPVAIQRYSDGYIVVTDDPVFAPATGQPLVFYRDNLVIGGGIVVGFN